ncbi:MAG: hypothetical protein L0Y56_00435 [Nitrospira sp.]|nr:hypothetical protein [Nitrospira sp.]
MIITKNDTPVLVLNCKIGGLAIMRSLGSLGVALHGVDTDPQAAGFMSGYCRSKFIKRFDESNPKDYLNDLLRIGERLGKKAILIPTSDELSVFVSEFYRSLSQYFIFPQNDPALVKGLISKKEMHELARKHDIPTPITLFPRDLNDVLAYAEDGKFPVMLKGIHGNLLQIRTGKKMVVVYSREELIENYMILEDPQQPNLMIQEYIPGGDEQIYIFNGYFNEKAECLAAFTGHKIRQYPIHVGCASLGVCRWNKEVSDMTIQFMQAIGYRGILDIGYRWDPRDGLYKVLDINPRVGQAFRLFLAENGMDVVRALYMDLTEQIVGSIIPREGRRWMIEDYDLEATLDYYREGTLRFPEWLKSFKGLEETAWFNSKDPIPFFLMCMSMTKKVMRWVLKNLGITQKQK